MSSFRLLLLRFVVLGGLLRSVVSVAGVVLGALVCLLFSFLLCYCFILVVTVCLMFLGSGFVYLLSL